MTDARPRGRVLGTASRPSTTTTSGGAEVAFARTWNAVDGERRRQVRRLVRVGRPQQSTADAELAVGFAAHQRGRPWYRLFWLWLPVLALAGLVAGLNVHPVVIGMVLAAVVNAVLVRRNFARVEKVNAPLLDTVVPAAS